MVVLGVNDSLDKRVEPLSFADDDAARYAETLGRGAASLSILTVLDGETQPLHPTIARDARAPTSAELDRTLAQVFSAIEQDRAEGREADFVFVYVGHGAVGNDGEGYVNLLDEKLTRSTLFERVVAKSPARFNHIIVDACSAYHLLNRGKKGGALAAQRLLQRTSLKGYPNTGALLSTSSDVETHQWTRIRGGVFSHEVLSALSGAADVDGGAALSTREWARSSRRPTPGAGPPRPHRLLHPAPQATAGIVTALLLLTRGFHKVGHQVKAVTLPGWIRLRYSSRALGGAFAAISLLYISFTVLILAGSAFILFVSSFVVTAARMLQPHILTKVLYLKETSQLNKFLLVTMLVGPPSAACSSSDRRLVRPHRAELHLRDAARRRHVHPRRHPGVALHRGGLRPRARLQEGRSLRRGREAGPELVALRTGGGGLGEPRPRLGSGAAKRWPTRGCRRRPAAR